MSLSSLLLSGGFALLASTGANLAGLGGPTAAVVGAVTPLHLPGLVTGLMPLVGAAALGFLGRTERERERNTFIKAIRNVGTEQ